MASVFDSPDLVPLWDRPPEFLPRHPPGGAHIWEYARVRGELVAVAERRGKDAGERRVALLAHPGLSGSLATEGLHAGIQLLLPGESAAPHRHTPAALRVGLEGVGITTMVDDGEVLLDPLDVVLNPPGTWHGHTDRGGAGGLWLDVVDLPLVSAMAAVLFEPSVAARDGDLLDPPLGIPSTVRFPWSEVEGVLGSAEAIDGVRTHRYGDGSVLPTLAVTAHAVDGGAGLRLPARTAGAVVLVARGRFRFDRADGIDGGAGVELDEFDTVALRGWTAASFTGRGPEGVLLVIDTSPAVAALGLYREEAAR